MSRTPGTPPGITLTEPDVYYAGDEVAVVTAERIAWLKASAARSARRRARLCMHAAPSASVHEMIIVHHRDAYVRPHRHVVKPESLHCIEGETALVLFDANGAIDAALELAAHGAVPFYARVPAGRYHTLLITSEWLVFAETTAGPFDRSQMEFADWSPAEDDPFAIDAYRAALRRETDNLLRASAGRSERLPA